MKNWQVPFFPLKDPLQRKNLGDVDGKFPHQCISSNDRRPCKYVNCNMKSNRGPMVVKMLFDITVCPKKGLPFEVKR